jgi:hypothetical protein
MFGLDSYNRDFPTYQAVRMKVEGLICPFSLADARMHYRRYVCVGYRAFPVLQKLFHRSELNDTLAKLLTPKEPSAELLIAAVAKTSL